MTILTEELIFSRTRVKTLQEVRTLNLWGCELSNVSLLKICPNLEVLSLSVNNLTSLAELSECKSLIELYLRKNYIADVDQVKHLSMLRNLQVLWLCDNPCAEDEKEYRYKVVRYLPWIKKLDHHDITDEEVLASMNSTSATMPPKIRNRLTSTSKPLAEPLSTFSQINLFNNSQSSEKVNNVSKMSSPISPVDFIIKKDRFPSAKVDDNMAVNGNGKTANQNSSSNNGQKKSIKSSRTKQAVPLGAINGNPNLSPSKMNNVMAGNKSPVNKTRSSVVSLMTPSRTISPNILSSVPKSYKSVNNSEEHSEMVLTLEGETEAISREKVKQNNEFDEPWQSNVLIAVLGLLDELNKTELQTVQRKLQLLILNQQRTLLGKVKESEIK